MAVSPVPGRETERPDAWREVVLTAIPKKSDKVGYEVHQSVACDETNILGYEPGRSTAGVTATLRQVLSKAAEWGVGDFVASADVEGAFDGIKHDDVEKALLQKGVHPESVCSLLRGVGLRCRLPFCMLTTLVRVAWKALTCGTRYSTAHSANLQVAGNRRELASCSPRATAKPKRGAVVHLVML